MTYKNTAVMTAQCIINLTLMNEHYIIITTLMTTQSVNNLTLMTA